MPGDIQSNHDPVSHAEQKRLTEGAQFHAAVEIRKKAVGKKGDELVDFSKGWPKSEGSMLSQAPLLKKPLPLKDLESKSQTILADMNNYASMVTSALNSPLSRMLVMFNEIGNRLVNANTVGEQAQMKYAISATHLNKSMFPLVRQFVVGGAKAQADQYTQDANIAGASAFAGFAGGTCGLVFVGGSMFAPTDEEKLPGEETNKSSVTSDSGAGGDADAGPASAHAGGAGPVSAQQGPQSPTTSATTNNTAPSNVQNAGDQTAQAGSSDQTGSSTQADDRSGKPGDDDTKNAEGKKAVRREYSWKEKVGQFSQKMVQTQNPFGQMFNAVSSTMQIAYNKQKATDTLNAGTENASKSQLDMETTLTGQMHSTSGEQRQSDQSNVDKILQELHSIMDALMNQSISRMMTA
ncbi:hypothetical protein JYU14_02270 [Simkania negevensis]|uniref:Uncharacterized protein n=1 Tax=Simkania negevensis TaxID=83561 RepID=A0ABS3AQ86_9BACT|nr:hypothetical protein [Simkania negevensis]